MKPALPLILLALCGGPVSAVGPLTPAFPGEEGAGRFTSGCPSASLVVIRNPAP